MWIVRLALRRPYTVAVMCGLILVMGILSLTRMVVDIFPAGPAGPGKSGGEKLTERPIISTPALVLLILRR